MAERKRILLAGPHWLGDVLFTTPAIRAVRRQYPHAFLAYLLPARVLPVLANHPQINELIVCQDKPSLFSWPLQLRMADEIRRRKFDTAIFFHRSKTKAFLVQKAGVGERIGYAQPGREKFLTQNVPPPQQPLHKIDSFLHLIDQAGIPADERHMDFFPAPNAPLQLARLLMDHGVVPGDRYALVHAGGNWDLKRWPVAHFIATIRHYIQNFRLKIVLCGTDSEKNISDEICGQFDGKSVVSLCGKTSLDALSLLLKNADFLLSNDSGPIHLAATQRTKILGLFGPTSTALTGPVSKGPLSILWKDVGCDVPCYFRSCNYRVCMNWLSPEEVYQKTRELLGG